MEIEADYHAQATTRANRIWMDEGTDLSRYELATVREIKDEARDAQNEASAQGGNPERSESTAIDTAATVMVDGVGLVDQSTGEIIMSVYKTEDNTPEIIGAKAEAPQASNVVAIYEAPQPVAASPLDLPVEVFRAGLDRRRENRTALMRWVREALVENVDFGSITVKGRKSKPSLWKPGAEKICGMLGVSVAFPTLADYEQAALRGAELKAIIIRCEIRDSIGRIIADGVGARNLAQDNGDLNKCFKMAEKSAHIDATLRLAGLSEVFTQDIEDMPGMQDKPRQEQRPAHQPEPPKEQRITADQALHLQATIKAYGLDMGKAMEWVRKACKVDGIHELTPNKAEKVLGKLAHFAVEQGTANPDTLKAKAEDYRRSAEIQRQNAQYADRGYNDEMRQAEESAQKANHYDRMAAQMAAALEPVEPVAQAA
ncbi:hypothetical protein MishRS11D_46410 (plasmid) [Methylomagnum ishizawai]|nr:hypothetical protein MishRS11D_46410 [Methylomagnum ishizawai]